jgi:hypothetical protein
LFRRHTGPTMNSPIKDSAHDFKSLSALKEKIPEGSVVYSYLLYGGKLECGLAEANRVVCAHTTRYAVYEFWNCILEDPQRIYEIVNAVAPQLGSPSMFPLLQESWPTYADPYMRAALFFILNRCSAEGKISTGTMNMKNFNPLTLNRLKNFKINNLYLGEITENEIFSGRDLEKEADYILLPLGTYGYNMFDIGKSRASEDTIVKHEKVAQRLQKLQSQKWVAIYNNHPEIFPLYNESNIMMIDKQGHLTSDQEKCQEVLIANF